MRVMVTGSRDWTDADTIRRCLGFVHGSIVSRPKRPDITLVHGGAAGADAIAARVAVEELGWQAEVFPADWDTHGKAAGPIRNREMLATQPAFVFAFPLPQSKGARDVIAEAKRRGIPVYVHGEGWA